MMRPTTLVLLLATGLAQQGVLAGDKPGGSAPAPTPAPSPWNASAGSAPRPRPSLPTGPLELTIYKGVNGWWPGTGARPGPGQNGYAYGVDVRTRMVTCPDGSSVVATLDVGGWTYQPDQACPGQPNAAPAPQSPGGPGPANAPVCDPRTWNCSSRPR